MHTALAEKELMIALEASRYLDVDSTRSGQQIENEDHWAHCRQSKEAAKRGAEWNQPVKAYVGDLHAMMILKIRVALKFSVSLRF